MLAPSTCDLLAAWEHGLARPSAERALALLAAAGAPSDAASLPVGSRDERLLDLRAWAFGEELTGAADCPECGAELELPFSLDAIRVPTSTPVAADGELEVDGETVRFRLPDGADLCVAAATGTAARARRVLLERCVLAATQHGIAVDAGDLSPATLEALERELAALDPQADSQISVVCPDCEHRWSAIFDIATFLWTEVDQWARRVLVDVATLASAFGWSESEILDLGPARREAYLELAGR